MKSLKWIAASVALALFGCGGEDVDGAAAGAVVLVAEIPAGLKVTASPAGAALPVPLVQDTTQYSFNARIASGPHAGQDIMGTLILHGSDDTGRGTQVEGSVVGTARMAAAAALLGRFDTGAQALRATLRTGLETASADLRQAMNAGTAGSAAQSQALLKFKQSFAALNTQYRNDVSSLNALLLAESAADSSEAVAPDADLQVSGTIDAQGQVALRVVLADQSVLLATGGTAADGGMAGNLAGQDNADLGNWTAAAQPMPAPAPAGNVTAGLAKYTALCASCHTDNVRRNVLNVAAANDVARLDAALTSIGSMTFLRAGMSAQDKLDVVAYILSAR